jgi:hypothetical protein
MCGIVGVISKHGTLSYYVKDLFTNMVRMDSVRGEDSTGVFGVSSSGLVDMMKGDTDGWKFTNSDAYDKFAKRIDKNYKIVIGHNRAATRGNVTPDNAHPFQEKHIMLVHNGTLRSTKGLKTTEVDSHAIAHALADHDPVQALAMLDGAYALVWYDASDKTLNLARNMERPLFILEYSMMWCIASEPGLPHWLNARQDRKMDKMQVVPTDKIWSWKLDKLDKGYFEIPYEDYKDWQKREEEKARKEREATRTSYSFPHSQPSISQGPNPEPKKTQVAALFKSPGDNVVNLTAGKTQPFKPNDEVVFELDDERSDDNGANILLGYPVINGVMDDNIVVRVALKQNDNPLRYFGLATDKETNLVSKYWKAKVQHCRNISGIWTVFAHDFRPHLFLEDAQGSQYEEKEVAEAVKAGCSKCSGPMTIEDVPSGIARKKADGKWRIVCPKCLNHAVQEASQRKPHLTVNNAQ